MVAQLLEAGEAYYAFSTAEEVEARHLAAGRNPKLGYDNFDRELTDAQRAAYLTDGRDPVVRLRMPDEDLSWDDLVRGAIGAIVLVDCRRLQDSFAAVDFFEHRNLPFVVAVNEFDGAPRYPVGAVREALTLPAHIPVISVDARDRRSATDALIAVSEYALQSLTA